MSKSSSVLAALALAVTPTLAAQAQPVTLLPSSLLRVRADNHFGVTKDSVINPPVFSPVPVVSSITDTEVGTTASATTSATYEVSLTGTTAVFDIQTSQSYTIGATGTLTEGFIQFTTSEPLVYELSGTFTGSSPSDREAYQQRTFLRQFETSFATAFLEDETRTATLTVLYVNQGNDTGNAPNSSFNQSGPRLGVLPAGTYEFAYELEVSDRDVDLATAAAASGRTRLVLRKPVPPANPRAVVVGQTVTLSWTASLDAQTYVLQAGSASGASEIFSGAVGNITALTATVPTGTYYIRVIALNGGAQGPASEEITFTAGDPACTTAPPVPATHTATVGGVTVDLGWTSSPGASAYVLDAGTAPSVANLASLNLGGRTTFTAAVPAGTYYTRVRAVNACGSSLPSNELILAPCVPPPATAIGFTRTTGTVTLTWTSAVGASAYQLQVGSSSGGSDIFAGSFGAGTTLTFPTTVLPAGIYYMRIVALGPCGPGTASNEVAVTLP
jgi:hypothetical protein